MKRSQAEPPECALSSSPSPTPTATRERASERRTCVRARACACVRGRGRGRAGRAERSRGVRVRTGVVFHKAALKVSWQPPAARLCKETTETSRSAQQPPCCLDFLRNLNELFVENHWSCLQEFCTAKTPISVSEDHILYAVLTFFFGLTLYFYRFLLKSWCWER